MKQKEIKFKYQVIEDISEVDLSVQKLIDKAKSALEKAYAPYSKFKVGAAVLLEDGQIFIGNNQENAAYPSGLCAERVALFAVKSILPNAKIKAIAIATNAENKTVAVAPCGSCRQVMLEYELQQNEDVKIYFEGEKDTYIELNSVKDLLPFCFHSEMLI